MEHEKRINDLEARLAYLEKIQAEQNQVIYEQHQTVDLLRKELAALRNQLNDSSNGGSGGADVNDPPPPHY